MNHPYARISTAWGVWNYAECNCSTKIMHARYFHVFWESSIQIGCCMAHSVHGVHEYEPIIKGITLLIFVDFQDMMNREKHYLLPKMQVGFIDAICHPIYKVSIQTMHGEFHKVQKLGHLLCCCCVYDIMMNLSPTSYTDLFAIAALCNFWNFFVILLWWNILYN